MKTPLAASSTTDRKGQPLLFEDLCSRKVVADFSGGTLSSDGGVLLVRQVDASLGVTASLAQCFTDGREAVYVDQDGCLDLNAGWPMCVDRGVEHRPARRR